MRYLKLIPDETSFGFMRFRSVSFPLSAALSILAVVLFAAIGLNMGIDFRGGTLMEVATRDGSPANVAQMRDRLATLDLGETQLQEFGAPSIVLIRLAQQPGGDAEQQAAVTKVRALFGDSVDYRRTEVVGPRVSQEFIQTGTIGTMVAIFGVLIYVWFRFEWQFALGAIIATLHDLVLTLGFYCIFQLDFDLTAMAAILTILGYSLNDTVVVYDRIREMLRKYKRMATADLLDIAINATLSRTVMTALTTIVALSCLAIVGGPVIRGFTLAMLFGVVIGTYSSIFIAAPVLIYLGVKTTEDKAEAMPARARP